jgi:hypothetical protein
VETSPTTATAATIKTALTDRGKVLISGVW